MNAKSAMPGEQWLVNLQPVDAEPQEFREVTVTLKDFDARTQTWSVEQDGQEGSIAVLAKHLVRRVD
jgi:hypothetical protein